ncbi:hypothetical protein BU25DRAFT_417273 [Macroventuria anomochaeta]|uniref:Uncharacterized protein n=1 Tax=Macroventuria anomochaeta TaxID=301207 RepID=A0ACB6SFC8_9PLEO|nr:uncharacterized protein BU25DRAFT_417273 [Macroventuria anomochaeta]KAF2632668.1 hypothetical protein BU25DRAFT_417273 [Macroventuria anomochaeta]
MSKLEELLRPHSIEAVCAADRADGKSYILIDVGRDSKGRAVPSLERLKRKVDKCLVTDKKHVFAATKLYIIGDWNAAEPGEGQNERKKTLADAQEWKDGVDAIRDLIKAMGNLKELMRVWTSGLPFMASVFTELPPKLTKLVLDLSHHVRVVDNGATLTKLHIRPEDMKPLLKQTRLLELRLLGLRDSLQFIAWKTVYLNQLPGGMRILELQMNAMPIIRNNNNKWHMALDVRGLTVAQPGLLEKPYKGQDGKGGLHWSFGYGEYLDGDCIRKARIASGVEEAVPLPLQCLMLDGFVIDHLPFEHELTDIVLLACGEKCIDAGMRAPKTQAEPYNPWSKKVNDAACRILIQWPNWTGIFDTEGDQRDTHGDVVSQEAGLSTPYAEYAPLPPPQLPLTEKTLNMKDVGDALNNATKPDYFNIQPALLPLSGTDTPLGAVSNLSERGSEVPTPTALSIATTDEIRAVDGSITSGSGSAASSYILHANGASDSTPEISPISPSCNSSFENDGPPRGHKDI